MIDVKLSVEDYNRLYLYYLQGEDEYEEIYVKIKDKKIIFFGDCDNDIAIASVDLNTLEGKILSIYTECSLYIVANDNGELFIHESCMNPNDPYLGHCHNCFIRNSQYGCEKGIREKIKKMDTTIKDLRFIDPIPDRNHSLVNDIEGCRNIIKMLRNDYSDVLNDDVKKILETAHLLQCQIEELCDKWNYGNFDRWDLDYV